jgi:hypothetical protein
LKIEDAMKLARRVIDTGERAEIVPSKDGAEVYILKRRKLKPNNEPSPKR